MKIPSCVPAQNLYVLSVWDELTEDYFPPLYFNNYDSVLQAANDTIKSGISIQRIKIFEYDFSDALVDIR